MHANFHCGVSATLIFCYKIACVAYVSLANYPIFFCNQDVHVYTMGCKRGFTIVQEALRKLEGSARDSTYKCNQAVGLSCCMSKVKVDTVVALKNYSVHDLSLPR